MLAPDCSSSHVCSKASRLAFLAAFCTLSLGQESFMMHFTPAGIGATVVNRGDFNNDGSPTLSPAIMAVAAVTPFRSIWVLGMGDSRKIRIAGAAKPPSTSPSAILMATANWTLPLRATGVRRKVSYRSYWARVMARLA